MKKAAITGFFTGVVISAILIGATYVRRFLPDTFTANLLFLTLFFGSIVTVIWLSLNLYSRSIRVRWMSLSLTGIVASLIAASLVSVHSFIYSRLKDPYYVDEIMQLSQQKWKTTHTAAGKFVDNLAVFSPADFALNNFRDLMLVLFFISLTIAAIYYLRHRNRIPDNPSTKNQELIF
jgi:hypothetical protein